VPSTQSMVWIVGLAFVAIQIAIGVWASRRIKNEADFFVAGRRLGAPLVSVSLFATWFGAETCMGASGAVYSEGLSGARAEPFGYFFCLVLLGAVLARRLHRGGYLTLGDLFRDRFGPRTEKVAVLILVPSGLVWGAAQVRAFAHVLAYTTDLPVIPAVWVAALLSIAYTVFGGLLGDVITDAFQGALLIAGLVTITVLVLLDLPAPSSLSEAFSADRLTLGRAGESALATMDRWSIPILGSLVAQELVARVLAAKSERTAVVGSFSAAALYLLVGTLPVFLGLLGLAVVPGLEEPEQLLVVLGERYLGGALGVAFALSLLCAILSTIDSILLSTSALVSHNLVAPLLPDSAERARLVSGRFVVILGGLFCTVVALYSESIYQLVEIASALGTAGLLVATLSGLFDPQPSARGAVSALVVGAGATPILEATSWDAPYLGSVLLAAFTYGSVRGLK
jgi:SSS family transporter